MKKLRNKLWMDRHAKKKHMHELKRSEKNRYIYIYEPYKKFEIYGTEGYYQSEKAKKRLIRKVSKESYDTLEAPENFSIFMNPEESLSFFSDIETRIEFGSPVYFDMKSIVQLSIDTIMYFLAILKRIKSSKSVVYSFKGSWPSNQKCRDLLDSSGFLKYVDSGRMKKDLSLLSEVIQIENGQKADNSIAKKVCDFAMSKLNLKRVEIKKLYVMIIELMTNTKHHAYNKARKNQFVLTDWYIFVRFINDNQALRFIFLDTGLGIPFTVKRKGFEPARELIGLGPNHVEYINSALKGEFRSRTGESYRGRGLPKIYSYFTNQYINNLTIISNHGYFAEDKKEDMNKRLRGTLFYWELSKES